MWGKVSSNRKHHDGRDWTTAPPQLEPSRAIKKRFDFSEVRVIGDRIPAATIYHMYQAERTDAFV